MIVYMFVNDISAVVFQDTMHTLSPGEVTDPSPPPKINDSQIQVL